MITWNTPRSWIHLRRLLKGCGVLAVALSVIGLLVWSLIRYDVWVIATLLFLVIGYRIGCDLER